MQKHTLGIIGASLLASCVGVDAAPLQQAPTNIAALESATAPDTTADISANGRGSGFADASPALRAVHTEHLGQLTDRAPNSLTGLGMTGTDLGISFQRADKLYVLFGDAWTTSASDANRDLDSIAWTSAAPLSGSVPRLTWFTRGNGQFQSFSLPGISLRAMSLPVEGVPIGDRVYLFFHTGWNDLLQRGTVSALAHAAATASRHSRSIMRCGAISS